CLICSFCAIQHMCLTSATFISSGHLMQSAWKEVTVRCLCAAWRPLWPECVLQRDFEGFEELEEEADIHEIVSLGNSMGLEVDDDDVEELVEEHSKELREEEDKEESRIIPAKDLKDAFFCWSKLSKLAEDYHPDVGSVQKAISVFNDNVMNYFWKVQKSRWVERRISVCTPWPLYSLASPGLRSYGYDLDSRPANLCEMNKFGIKNLVFVSLKSENGKYYLHHFAHSQSFTGKQRAVVCLICSFCAIQHTCLTSSYILHLQDYDAIRSKAQNYLAEVLRQVPGISKDWVSFGRLCSPRVLFIFSSRLLPVQIKSQDNSSIQRTGQRTNRASPLRNLELALEDQIYRLLRKSRVITNISANSLFALPNNQAYVYIMEESQEEVPPSSLINNTLRKLCSVQGSYVQYLVICNTEEHSFNVFLQQHIDQALGKGFDDNVGRHSGPVFFQVPRASVWFDAVNRVYKFFMLDPSEKDTKAKQILGSLQILVETEVRFSDARCAKVLPLAISAYKDGLPPHYTHMHHQEKLELALSVLSAQARGPMYEEYVSQLEDACERIWQDGRMGCETLSLTGNTCKHPRHKIPNDPDDDSFCNCGRRQGQREDSFSVKTANHSFYQQLAEACCTRLESISFSTFKPSVTNAKAAKVDGSEDDEMEVDGSSAVSRDSREQLDSGTPHTPGLSLVGTGLSGSMNNATGTAAARMTGDQTHIGSQVVITLTKDDSKVIHKDRGIIRQASTTEYLPGMLHTASPPELLPRWSSWSLCCLGPSSLYSHNAENQKYSLSKMWRSSPRRGLDSEPCLKYLVPQSPVLHMPPLTSVEGATQIFRPEASRRALSPKSGESRQVAWISHKVQPYILSPRQCFHCQMYGHFRRTCRKLQLNVPVVRPMGVRNVRAWSAVFIIREAHPTSSSECDQFQLWREVLHIPTRDKVSFAEAGSVALKSLSSICDQPGFLPGTNFLLPWDVTVKIEDRDKWPAIADTLGKKALLPKNKKNRVGDIHEFTVKIFLGVEYECVRGHRFMMATPDRHLKASPSGLVKDNATKIANADMPLYFPCPCSRSGGGIVNGQLMRLHVVTPKAPVNVTLSPQVQPGPDPCPRYIPQPCSSLPVKLSASAYWVLRLPYVYVGDQGPHYPPDPRQPTPPSFARLHKGCYGISQKQRNSLDPLLMCETETSRSCESVLMDQVIVMKVTRVRKLQTIIFTGSCNQLSLVGYHFTCKFE
ncbi:SMG8-like, partial [Homarus americanus]